MENLDPRHWLRAVEVVWERVEDERAYPYSLPFVRELGRLELARDVTFLVGENGSGKSTLLEAMAIGMGFNVEGGGRNNRFLTADTHSKLHSCLRLSRGKAPEDGFFLRAESYFNFATYLNRLGHTTDYGGRSLHAQSHGESFFALFQHRLGRNGLYLFDEPEAALSPTRQMALLARMRQLVQAGSQFVIATHSPIVLAYPGALIYQLSERGIERLAYEQTETYTLYRHFLEHREPMLHELFKEAD